jgi:hypothetical protein
MFVAAPVFADSSETIAVVATQHLGLAQRVAAELRALGFTAEAVETLPQADAQSGRTLISVVLKRSVEQDLDAWSVRIRAGSAAERTDELSIDPDGDDARLALRVAESIRAALVQDADGADESAPPAASPIAPLSSAPREETDAMPGSARARVASVAVVFKTAPVPPTATFDVGFAALWSPGGLGVSYGVALAAGAYVTPALRLGLSAFVPVHSLALDGDEGVSRSRVTLVSADLRAEFRRDARLSPTLGGGLGIAILSSKGQGSAPDYVDASATRVSAGAHLEAGLWYRPARHFAIGIDLDVGVQLSRFALTYGGRETAHWGRPWVAGGPAFALRL